MSWIDAAKRYARATTQSTVRASEIEQIVATTRIITSFTNSRVGLEARLLLEASRKMIGCGGDAEYMYFFGPQGPVRVASDAPFLMRRPIPVPASDLAKALVRSGKKADEVIRFFRDEIDMIAKDAPDLLPE